ncbi:hypothetical protein ARMSODRAFT_897308 [Armillaria solidipes]|uniref:CxC2-like cysteine cluster KDZ transposase-associated domain-containing protein n=1 Tax=Armillaria solidipes TaxID=1076256 RepID=A0A2H3AW30_9AGAR|nr:hypothetical protein ARMSODRAFT_897308 [Armillaria solidipes]
MYAWIPFQQDFLDELLRHEEFSTETLRPWCATCSCLPELFRCESCGEFSECQECCLVRHQCSPLHCISRWNGEFWENTTLEKLGLTFQLGHAGGECPIPGAGQHLTVLHMNGVHSVQVSWCGCNVSGGDARWQQLMHNGWYPVMTAEPQTCSTFECLDTFRLLNVITNVNVHDYVSTLEQKMDAWGMEWVPDRYKGFGRMSRQWACLMRLKRVGVGHLKDGISSVVEGSVAVPYWACPREGMNLPVGSRDLPAEVQ